VAAIATGRNWLVTTVVFMAWALLTSILILRDTGHIETPAG
jgi:hypothetical protein